MHFFSRVVRESDTIVLDFLTNEVKVDIYMFHSSLILVVLRQCDCYLIVREKRENEGFLIEDFDRE